MNALQKATAGAIVNVFETGRVRGDYAAIAVMKGDSGHLSYGRSQAALGGGTLYTLLRQYCEQPGALFSAQLKPQLPRFEQKDISLDQDTAVRALLQQAGRQDPVMRATQDQFFNANYFAPACRDAEAVGVMLPLGQAIVYDSHVQGGWGRIKDRVGAVGQRGEQEWAKGYIATRRAWLSSLNPPLPSTVYRMDAFAALIAQGKWELTLPLTVHGITITEDALGLDAAGATDQKRTLRLTTPYLRGDDVKALQRALAKNGQAMSDDGVYGPFTDTVVKAWQASRGITEDGVGPITRTSLGL